jgi:rSAM-associated Gly-rich repeat protein
MAFLSRSRLFGILLIVASLPMDPGMALATGMAGRPDLGDEPSAGSVESRLRRIAEAVRERQELVGEPSSNGVPDDALAVVFVNGPGVGWGNGGFRNGGFYNGGFRNGGFYNGGFRNGGFYNGGFRNGGFLNHW